MLNSIRILLAMFLLCGKISAGVHVFSGRTDRFTTRDGLPHNTITSLYQDKTGFLWVGTSIGLCRYDGIDFMRISIPGGCCDRWSQLVQSMYEDSAGTLWFGTRSGEIISLDAHRRNWQIHGKSTIVSDFIDCFFQDHKGKLWFGTVAGLIGYYDYGSSEVSWVKNVQFNLKGLYLDRQDRLWLSSHSQVVLLNSRSMSSLIVPRDLRALSAMYMDQSGQLLIYSKDSCKTYDIDPGLNDTKEFIWFSGRYVFTYSRPEKTYNRYLAFKESGDYLITDVVRDRTGLIWLATDIGLIKIDPARYRFNVYSTEEGVIPLDNNYIRALSVSGDKVWLGFKNGPVTALRYCPGQRVLCEKQNYRVLDQSGSARDRVTINTVCTRKNGEVWCGGLEGLFKLQEEKKAFENHMLQDEDGLKFAAEEVWTLAEDPKGRLWVGGRTIGLWYINDLGESRKVEIGGEGNVSVWKIYPSFDGSLWIGASTGLYRVMEVDGQEFRVIPVKSLDKRNIWDIGTDGNGRYYIASTDRGFSIYNEKTKKVTHYGMEEGLPSNSVSAVQVDSSGIVWLSSDNGLSRLDIRTGAITNFYEEDGLVSNDFNFSVSSQSTSGELFFGTKNGLLTFFPFKIPSVSTSQARVVITSFQTDGEEMLDSLYYTGKLNLDHNHNNVRFRFSLLDYGHPFKNSYRYRLEPFDKSWKKTDGRSPVAMYTNLTPDDYTFIVEGSVDGMNWQSDQGRFSFSIQPAFWQQLWFTPVLFGSVLMLFLGGFYLRFRYNLNAERRKNEIDKKMAALELSALQAQMNPHFIFNAVNSVQHFMLKGDLLAANDYLTRFAKLMRFFLEASINKKVRLNEELEMLSLYLSLESLRFDACFDFKIICPPSVNAQLVKIPAMLIQPYVENAIYHGLSPMKAGGQLTVEIVTGEGQLIFVIDDNGIGREKARKLRNTLNQERRSRAMQLMEERMEVYNLSGEETVKIEIIDKKDPLGKSLGTKVIIKITDKK